MVPLLHLRGGDTEHRLRILNAAHNPSAPANSVDVIYELGLLRRCPAGRGLHLQRHELGHAINHPITDKIRAANAQARMERPALAHDDVTGLHSHHPAALNLDGLACPARADVVAPQPGAAGTAGQEDSLLGGVFAHAGSQQSAGLLQVVNWLGGWAAGRNGCATIWEPGAKGSHYFTRQMAATNYDKPVTGDYQLIRIKGKQAEILDPDTLGKILSILELHECNEGQTDRPLWDALYRSQPFHSAQTDSSGAYWRIGRFFAHAAYELPRMFVWATKQGHIPPAPSA